MQHKQSKNESPHLKKKQGIWVFGSGKLLSDATVQRTIRRLREERDNKALGKQR